MSDQYAYVVTLESTGRSGSILRQSTTGVIDVPSLTSRAEVNRAVIRDALKNLNMITTDRFAITLWDVNPNYGSR